MKKHLFFFCILIVVFCKKVESGKEAVIIQTVTEKITKIEKVQKRKIAGYLVLTIYPFICHLEIHYHFG